jgi:hypothetical protein
MDKQAELEKCIRHIVLNIASVSGHHEIVLGQSRITIAKQYAELESSVSKLGVSRFPEIVHRQGSVMRLELRPEHPSGERVTGIGSYPEAGFRRRRQRTLPPPQLAHSSLRRG